MLIEAELFEPTYNLHLAPEVTELFVDAILGRVRATEPERSL